jgi:hypothetical protein
LIDFINNLEERRNSVDGRRAVTYIIGQAGRAKGRQKFWLYILHMKHFVALLKKNSLENEISRKDNFFLISSIRNTFF